jgi:hypothetical protein
VIHILIFLYLSVLVDDSGHEVLATAGYILSGLIALTWLGAVLIRSGEEE